MKLIQKVIRVFVALFAVNLAFNLTAATVVTDQQDYPPTSTAIITGSGFQAGETVVLQVLRIDINENSGDEHEPWQVTADESGSFTTSWYVSADEEGATLQLTAVGQTSGLQAQWTFTDGNSTTSIDSVAVGAQGGTAATYGTANANITYTVTVGYTIANSGNGGQITPSISTLPSGVSASWNPTAATPTKGTSGNTTFTLTLSTTTTAKPTNLTFTVTATGQSGSPNSGTANGALLISPKPLSISGVTAAGKVYNGTTTATLSGGSLSGVINGDTVSITAGTGTFASKNVGSQSVTATGYALSGSGAANYVLSAQPTVANATISAAPLTITANNDSKTYGQTKTYGTGQTAFASSGLQNSETIGSVTLTASGGTLATDAVGSYNLTPSAATGGTFSASNYNITYNNGTLTVSKANVTLALSSTANPSTNAASLSFIATATATGSVTPTGTIQLLTNGVAWGSPASLVSGSAQIAAPTTLPHGYTSVSAQFTDGATFNSTNSTAINQLVNNAPTGKSKTLGTTQNQPATITLSKWLNRQDLDADGDVLTIASYNQTTTQGGTVSVASGGMTYTPANDFFGSDSFTYTVTDGYTNLTLTVNVSVVSADASSGNIVGFTAPNYQGGIGAKIKFLGVPGAQRYVQYRSVNGGGWVTFSTNTMPASGLLEIEDQGSLGDLNGRTYRTSNHP
jgi:hypothetical protein